MSGMKKLLKTADLATNTNKKTPFYVPETGFWVDLDPDPEQFKKVK